MKRIVEKVLHYAILIAVTAAAIGVMAWVSSRSDSTEKTSQEAVSLAPVEARPRPLVTAQQVTPALHEVTARYSGKLRPWETYSLAFEQPGRIIELGQNAAGQPFDDGDRVTAGQVLARLDDRVLRARRAEAVAQYEQAQTDLERVRSIRDRQGVVTESDFQQYLTQFALAQAQQEVATKNFEDAILYAPVDGKISYRMAEPGESVGVNEVVFELVQLEDVLLVIDVPEADIRELEERMRRVAENQITGTSDPEGLVFRARVRPEGRDRLGRRWPTIDAEVYRIAEVADSRTGLFEVEIRVPNPDGMLRPGMVCTADLVVNRLSAYRIPESAVLFRSRGEETDKFLYELKSEDREVQVMFWPVGTEPMLIAHRVDLPAVIDQGQYILVPSSDLQLDRVVVRGQQRLSSGKLVRLSGDEPSDGPATASTSTGEEPGATRR